MYYDLAYVLVEAKTENIHKNVVSMILRSSWTKWSPKDPPLRQAEFYRLLFILGHLVSCCCKPQWTILGRELIYSLQIVDDAYEPTG